MGEAAYTGGEDFGGDDEGGAVGAEVEEELGEGEEDEFAGGADVGVAAGEDGEEEGLCEELGVSEALLSHGLVVSGANFRKTPRQTCDYPVWDGMRR